MISDNNNRHVYNISYNYHDNNSNCNDCTIADFLLLRDEIMTLRTRLSDSMMSMVKLSVGIITDCEDSRARFTKRTFG